MSTPDSPVPPGPPGPPVPSYGEYATPEQQAAQRGSVPPAGLQPYSLAPSGQQPYYASQYGGNRPLRTGDMVASLFLIGLGFFGVLFAILNAVLIDSQMEQLYIEYDASGSYVPSSATRIGQAVIILSHVLLYIPTVIITVALIRKRRVSFWLPLSAGVLAAIIFFVVLTVLILLDPNLFAALEEQSRPR